MVLKQKTCHVVCAHVQVLLVSELCQMHASGLKQQQQQKEKNNVWELIAP